MKQFWALVGNSRTLKSSDGFKSTIWWKFYVIFFLLAALIGYSILIYRGLVAPFTLLIVIPYLVFVNFGLSLASIRQEWRGQTVSWWLTLPYSRLELMLAKLVANFIRFLKIVGVSSIALAILAVEGMWLNPAVWSPSTMIGISGVAIQLFIFAIAVSPAAITLGMLLGVTLHSRLKPLLPVIWALAVFVFSWASSFITKFFTSVIKGAANLPIPQMPILDFTTIIFVVLVPFLMAAIFIGVSSYILAEHTEV